MKTLLQHNRVMFKVIDRWFKRNEDKEDKHANILCEKCGEVLLYSGPLIHHGGPFFKREVSCPNCGREGIKLIKMWELETLKNWDFEKIQ
ncbi:hypothetical protein KA005_27930 [bacterium]|nr:hypothetical protein [bacterium]